MVLRGMRAWLLGLLHAAIAGAANAAAGALADPEHFNLTGDGAAALGKMALVGATIGLVMYLKQSPLPPAWNGREPRYRPNPAPPGAARLI